LQISILESIKKGLKGAASLPIAYLFHNIGVLCEKSGTGQQAYANAEKWYRKSAEHGYADAQFCLGLMYYNGQGVEQDYGKALEWWGKAASQEHARAQYNLGVMYNNGEGVWRDRAKAMEWFGRSCDNGLQQGCEWRRMLSQSAADAYCHAFDK
jgi:TPR repeat protein